MSLIFIFIVHWFLNINNCKAQWVQCNGIYGGHVACFAVSGSNLFAGTYTSLFVSNDSGMTWNNISAGTNIDSIIIGTIAVINSQLFVGGFFGGGGWRLPISSLSAIIEKNKVLFTRKKESIMQKIK